MYFVELISSDTFAFTVILKYAFFFGLFTLCFLAYWKIPFMQNNAGRMLIYTQNDFFTNHKHVFIGFVLNKNDFNNSNVEIN